MYASDRDIRTLLPELEVETAYPEYPFKPNEQVQPCSVDLRLDTRFWVPRRLGPWFLQPWRRGSIDLHQSRLHEVAPRRYWKQVQLKPGETLRLKPGRMVLCRTYEQFSMPTEFAGKIEGRSSFARLGLGVHCTGDFINPGWRGHMPLELLNANPNEIRVVPLMTVCQLLLVKLTSTPERTYGDAKLSSKYIDDDGGPSYWWRDQLITDLLNDLGQRDLSASLQQKLIEELGDEPTVDVLLRLERFVHDTPIGAVDSVPALLDRFAKREDRTRGFRTTARAAAQGAAPLFFALALASLFVTPWDWRQLACFLVAFLATPPSIYVWSTPAGEYLGVRELAALRKGNANPT
jgi:deoxycytidine triphosphate deaminase